MVSTINKILFTLFACIALVACTVSEGVITADVDYLGWEAGNIARVEYDNKDSLARRKLYILVRRNASLSYDNIRFRVETTSPSKKYLFETIIIPFRPEPESHRGFTEIEVPYRTGSVLSEKGRYKFYISHEGESLIGIQGVGIVIK